ncbi:hypothetical protein TCAL_11691 [Tigriopus californicus]|uniref:RBR-type E3 ubiquitin transferase n=1 Tax=Tigriopus californicus TaxID=6832 RepID=A0A553PLL0_TIGCA|nr:E3 ubiquitin-protein ligase RNF14-like [Tigriopus californicus]TRY78559.1 hypothetical protein TCAL_11691 [Tigriopus californicus]|eukprot:TCALIF_11691-PA protein Name:"Similar to RNF14 E3 ubiquitin-protein ligase RNF14 (Homo sapiens)" AED:0.00 eAED:0.10 QI:0/-1/0/1/-1/1/1/0/461
MEAQNEEILVLQSIFTDQEFQWNDHKRKGLFWLEVSVPSDFSVFLSVHGAESLLKHSIDYLSPLTLEFVLPRDYPEISAPQFEVKCGWMSPDLSASVVEGLLEIWKRDQGPILFAWTTFLKELGFSHLDGDNGMEVETQSILTGILAYDQDQKTKIFRDGIQTCQICFIDTCGWDFVTISGCQHAYCSDCLTHYCVGKIEDGAMSSIPCPFPDCTHSMETQVVKKLTPSSLYEAYDAKCLNLFLRTISGTTWCPRVNCQYLAEVLEDQCGQCPDCGFVFCLTCGKAFHGPSSICEKDKEQAETVVTQQMSEPQSFQRILQKKGRMEVRRHLDRIVGTMFGYMSLAEQSQLVRIYLDADEEKKKTYDDFFGRPFITYFSLSKSGNFPIAYKGFLLAFQGDRNEEDLLEPYKLISAFANMSPCPVCFIPIEKTGGCHHMHCSICGAHFCWDCLNLMRNCICYS